ncbi:unnamed protein product [Echinostoma caproni]|uniref:Serine/threonine-protein kinase TBK1 n=1 Tax=Echinostoma caproni TaxID=27848 RepID=A0A183B633_9TREM|nr:unnamed protein product [Echinostoma caproni]
MEEIHRHQWLLEIPSVLKGAQDLRQGPVRFKEALRAHTGNVVLSLEVLEYYTGTMLGSMVPDLSSFQGFF